MEIIMLGTSAMVPTKERSHSAILVYHEKDSLLFDCGEGAQRQMKILGADINRISRIFISHWHGDHVLGLPGLLQTMSAQDYSKTLHIYGPPGTKKHFSNMLKAFEFDLRMDVKIHESKNGIICKSDEYRVECLEMKHSVPTIGFSLIENPKRKMNVAFMKKIAVPRGPLWSKLQNGEDIIFNGKKVRIEDATILIPGKKITYITDTSYCTNAVKLAENSDLLIIEATFLSEKEDKAEEYDHLTAKQAALIANNANVKKLVLTHFSQRYKTTHDIEEEAKTYFASATCAYDFMKIKL